MVSGVQADPTRNVVEGQAASTDKIAETVNGVFEDTYVSSAISGVQAHPTRNVIEGQAASMSEIAETANGVFEDTADGIVVLS
jgi:hypothetical protein